MTTSTAIASPLSTFGRYVILVCAFLGWLCAGMHMSISQLAGQPAAIDLLSRTGSLDAAKFQEWNKRLPKKGALTDTSPPNLSDGDTAKLKRWKAVVARWFAWYQCAFLFGAATGGLLFGRLGDRIGRAKAMAVSILTYSLMAAAASQAQSPEQLLLLWYLACTGVGGMWPNGVALVSEAWAGMSRPMVAGVIGTSANIGIFLLSTIATKVKITPDEWRWVMQVGASPLVLGLFSLIAVPESPRWLAARRERTDRQLANTSHSEIFRPPLLKITLVGIILATIPIIGGWGTASWMIPWADEAAATASSSNPSLNEQVTPPSLFSVWKAVWKGQATPPGPYLKAQVNQARAITGIVGSLLGGWIASTLGRRRTYFLVSLACLCIAQYTFWFVVPIDASFLLWVAALGFFSGIYFGWLPLFLPELFPTRVRSTGAGVSFNFGRILTAITVFATGALMEFFAGDYARIGRITSLAFALGMLAVMLAPDTSRKQLED